MGMFVNAWLKKTVMVKGKKSFTLVCFSNKYATSSVIADISNQLKTQPEHKTTTNRFSGARVSHDLSLLSYFIIFYLWFLLLQQISGVFDKKKKTLHLFSRLNLMFFLYLYVKRCASECHLLS